jgi:ribonuclease G
MQADIEYLTKLWRDLTCARASAARVAAIPGPQPGAARAARHATEETSRVLVDSRETFVRMQEFARDYTPALADRIHHYVGERPLFDLHGVEDEIEKALARRVDLKSAAT